MKKVEARQGCIYLLTNLVNGKRYVGQTRRRNVSQRWDDHIKNALDRGCMLPLCCAIRKAYKRDGNLRSFSAEELWNGDVTKLNEKETYYVEKYHSFIEDTKIGGYNLTRGGNAGTRFSELARKNMSKAALRRFENPVERLNLSKIHTARWKDPAVRVAAGNSIKAAHSADPMYRERLRSSHIGLHPSKVAKRNQRAATRRRQASEKPWFTDETRKTLANKARAQWAAKHEVMVASLQNRKPLSKAVKAVLSEKAFAQHAKTTFEEKSRIACKSVATKRAKRLEALR